MEIDLVSEASEEEKEYERKDKEVAISSIQQIDNLEGPSAFEETKGVIELEQIEIEEVKEDSAEIVRNLILDSVLQAVYARITEKDKIESKRKTWNKIRKIEKVQEAEKRRSKWKYAEPTVSIRDKLNSIFREHEE